MLNGVVRFVDAQKYAGGFGFQWKLYARTKLDDAASDRSENAFRQRTGFRPDWRVLDTFYWYWPWYISPRTPTKKFSVGLRAADWKTCK